MQSPEGPWLGVWLGLVVLMLIARCGPPSPAQPPPTGIPSRSARYPSSTLPLQCYGKRDGMAREACWQAFDRR